MLKRLDRHLVLTLLSSTGVVLFALLSIDMLGKIIAEADILGNQNYHFGRLLIYVLGLVPLRLVEFFPMALLIGALMGLGRLAALNELTVMQTAGVSRLRIGCVGFLLAVLLGGLIVLISEFIGVSLNRQVEQMRAEALGQVTHNHLAHGVWAQEKNHFIHVGGVHADGTLARVAIYQLDEHMQFKQIIKADKAQVQTDYWLLSGVVQKYLSPQRIEVVHPATLTWENTLDRQVLDLLLSDPEDLSIRDLYRYINYQQANAIKPTGYALVFWQRLFLPLSTGVMFLLALPFVFGSQRSAAQGYKLFIGILLGLLYFVSYTSIANIILLTGAPVILGAIIPVALFMLISFALLWLRA